MNVRCTHPPDRCNPCATSNRTPPSCRRSCCSCEGCNSFESVYRQFDQVLTTETWEKYTTTISIREARIITVFVKNIGQSAVTAHMQNSPNAMDFVDHPQLLTLGPGEIGYVVPYVFSKYIRMAVISESTSMIRVWIQIQNFT